MLLDILAERSVLTLNGLEQKALDQNQANASIQIAHHVASFIKFDAQVYRTLYKDDITRSADLVLEAYGRWWRRSIDVITLRQEIAAIRESFQPLLKSMHTGLKALAMWICLLSKPLKIVTVKCLIMPNRSWKLTAQTISSRCREDTA